MNGSGTTEQAAGPDEDYRLLFPDSGLMPALDRSSIASGGRIRGTLAGKRRSYALGGSQEFADYRPYVPGDDVRRIDWNVYGRTGKAYLRQYWDEQELHVHLYLDVSRSMLGTEGSTESKLLYALRLAACVGYVALGGDDRLVLRQFDETGSKAELGALRGRSSTRKLFRYLADAHRAGIAHLNSGEVEPLPEAAAIQSLDLSAAFRTAGALPRRSGAAWLFTDGMYERGLEETLQALRAAGQSVVVVAVLSPEELNPGLTGELRLIDSELGTGKEVAISSAVLSCYREEIDAHIGEWKRICGENGAAFLALNTGMPLRDALGRLMSLPGMLSAK